MQKRKELEAKLENGNSEFGLVEAHSCGIERT
jgi:hypothetical protein